MIPWVALVLCGAPAEVAILAVGDEGALAGAVASLEARERAAGGTVLSQEELRARLSGMRQARSPDEAALTTMLNDAREHEARFDAAAAQGLRREILRAWDESVAPTAPMRAAVLAALQDSAASDLAEGRSEAAATTARDAVRRFGSITVDGKRHPPAVRALFAAAAEAVAAEPRRVLRVSGEGMATLLVEGRELAASTEVLEVALPPGRYRLWAAQGEHLSAPRVVDLTDDGASTSFGPLDWRLRLVPLVGLGAGERPGPALAEICARARVTRCLLLGVAAEELRDVATGSMALEAVALPAPSAPVREGATSIVVAPRHPAFSPWYLVPFGAGQLRQQRFAVGAAFLAAESALALWHGIALWRHGAARRGEADEEMWRGRRNLSAGLFYAALVSGIGEALLHGALAGD